MCSLLSVSTYVCQSEAGKVVQEVTHSVQGCFHLLAAQFQWGGRQMEHRCTDGDRWAEHLLAHMILKIQKHQKGSSVRGFFVCFGLVFLLQGLFHRYRSGHSTRDCLWVGLAWLEQNSTPSHHHVTFPLLDQLWLIPVDYVALSVLHFVPLCQVLLWPVCCVSEINHGPSSPLMKNIHTRRCLESKVTVVGLSVTVTVEDIWIPVKRDLIWYYSSCLSLWKHLAHRPFISYLSLNSLSLWSKTCQILKCICLVFCFFGFTWRKQAILRVRQPFFPSFYRNKNWIKNQLVKQQVDC